MLSPCRCEVAVFISVLMSTEVNKGTSLNEVRVAVVHICKSIIKGVWVGGEVCVEVGVWCKKV